MANTTELLARNLDSMGCSLESLMKTAANELSNWGLTVNNLGSSASKQAMLGCSLET